MTNLMGVLRKIVRDAVAVDFSKAEIGFALRCTVGVAIPLLAGGVTGSSLAGVSAAYGALVTGFASRAGVYRTRAIGMIFTALALAISGVAGVLTSQHPTINLVLAGAWAAAFGLISAIGASATTASINAVVAFVLYSNSPFVGSDPWFQGAMVIAGGILQTLLLVLVWPLQRFRSERHALATSYRALAAYAGHVNVDDFGLPESASLIAVRASLADPQPFGSRNELAAFEVLADEAERLRESLTALTSDYHMLSEVGVIAAARAIGSVATAAGGLLGTLADAVDRGIEPVPSPAAWDALAAAVRDVETAAIGASPSIGDARKLAGQLRAAWRAARAAANGGVAAAETTPIVRFEMATIGDAFTTLRANVSLHSSYARHAIRFGVAVMIAIAIQRALPLAHGQWIALTVALVLRPDFSSTFSRGVARMIGTIGGAILASVIAAFHPPDSAYVVLAIAFAALSYALFNASYAVFSGAITGYVVYLLAIGGSPEHNSAIDRVSATAIGGALALIAYLVWPTWARERVGEDLAALLTAQARYANLILRAFLDPAHVDRDAIREAQFAARRARSNAEASVDQMKGEPVGSHGLSLSIAQGILAASRRIAVASLTLSARIGERDDVSRRPLEKLIADLGASVAIVVAALHAGTSPPELPPTRDDQSVLARAVEAEPDAHWEVLVTETDVLVDSIDSIGDLLRRK
jgi:uncharacterized membrane protein YccC